MPFVDAMAAVDRTPAAVADGLPSGDSAMALRDLALSAMAAGDPLTDAVRSVAREMPWYRIFAGGGEQLGHALADGVLATQVAGQFGVFRAAHFRCGLFLLAPGIHYPPHTHTPAEVYQSVSGTLSLEHRVDGRPFDLTPGRHSVTPPNRVHSLSTGDEPVLLLFAWIDDRAARNWVWKRDVASPSGWSRTAWLRQPDASWVAAETEAVDAATFAEATA